ncbi:MAG TPA: hypothetical protein VHK69_13415 [Chitinophagaceae bacterium]|nr:hypothetical protein [Chitinophagaceae bacterium]
MKLGEELLKKLSKKYEPAALFSLRHKGNDVVFKTDDEGNPIQLFIGRKDNHGVIKGIRFRRVLKTDKEGKVLKDHWDEKGKAS